MHPSTLVVPMTAHVALAASLYVVLTIMRAPAIWGVGRLADGSNPWARFEPRVSANLSNQFEWPLFFHAGCLLLMHLQATSPAAIALAWIFVGGRIAHTSVQVGTGNVRLRGLVFTINFLAVLGLWAIAVLAAIRS
jgi:hypothetical protein